MKIYVPQDTTYNKCYVVQGEGVIRGYDRQPTYNTNYSYRDYYINSSYIFKDNVGQWGQYSTLPICLDNSVITNEYWYRNDISNILIVFIILSFFIVIMPLKLFSKLFGRWLKL